MLNRLPLATLALVLVMAAPAAATTITVTTNVDAAPGNSTACKPSINCSLRHAITAAQNGDMVSVPAGSYTLTQGQLVVGGVISIVGAGARVTTFVQSKGSNRVIEVHGPNSNAPAGLTLSGVTLTGGSVDDTSAQGPGGGGILVDTGNATLVSDQIIGNQSQSSSLNQGATGVAAGGGVDVAGSGTGSIVDSTIAGNHATATDLAIGGIAAFGNVSIDNSTISGNIASVSGQFAAGGIEVGLFTTPVLNLANVTLAGNRASGATGGNAVNAGNLLIGQGGGSIADSIIAGGQGDPGHENCVDFGGAFTSRGHNLEDRSHQCAFSGAGDLAGANPALGTLVDNGGQTDTQALGPGSAAIDAGDPAGCKDSGGSTVLTTDQRGQPRSGRCDIGAFEIAQAGGGGTGGGGGGGGGTGGGPQPGSVGPALSHFVVTPSRFRAAPSGPTTARRATTGTTISYQDTLAATTTFTVLQSSAGIRRGKSCVAPPKRPSRHRAKRCTRFRVMGSFTHVDAAGANRPHFSGRLRGRKLKPGSYRLQAVARNAAGQSSATMVASFRVTP